MGTKIIHVEDDQAFWFKDWNGNVDFVAHDVREFKKALKLVSGESLEFHLREDKNDFSAWLEVAMKRKDLANSIWGVKEQCLTGNDLRKSLLKCFTTQKSKSKRTKQKTRTLSTAAKRARFKAKRAKLRAEKARSKAQQPTTSLKHTLRKALIGKR